IERLRVDGGLARSATLMQIQSDLLQAPVDVFGSPHATALGAVACARLALDETLTISDAPIPWHPSQSYTPAIGQSEATAFRAHWLSTLTANLPQERS